MYSNNAVNALAAALAVTLDAAESAQHASAAAAWDRLTPKQQKIIRTAHDLCELTASATLVADPEIPSPDGWDSAWAGARMAFSRACAAAGISEDDALDAVA
ncbi:hypothetical protein [Nocardiopsis rhodophaea]|uniref:hypothetical protein n=1 Tax=Nocardiopsis rhodophaea TaxID=280238 RepID=UPI0031DDD014